MKSRRTVEEWRRRVYRSRSITDGVRVVLLFLADRMSADCKVSVPRKDIAASLGVSERRISERVSAAHAAGLLDTVSPGYRGHLPVYIGIFGPTERVRESVTLNDPTDPERVTHTSTLNCPNSVTLSKRKRVTPVGPTIDTGDRPETTHDRNKRSNEETEPAPAHSSAALHEGDHRKPDTCETCEGALDIAAVTGGWTTCTTCEGQLLTGGLR